MNQQDMNVRINRLKFALGMMFLALIIVGGLSTYKDYKQNQLEKGLWELLMFDLNVTKYCAELNNMTYKDLLESFLESEMGIMLEDFREEDKK